MPYDTHQGDKVGSSAAGELNRSKDNFIAKPFPQGLETMVKLWNMVKYFESNPANRKNYDLIQQVHTHLPTNEFKIDLSKTRVGAVFNLVRS